MRLGAALALASLCLAGWVARAENSDNEARIESLKAQIEAQPNKPRLRLLLAQAYLDDDNPSWALRTLYTLTALDPQRCEPQLWIAWIHLHNGAREPARETLLETTCPAASPDETRRLLLLALVEQRAEHRAATTTYLQQARREPVMYREDRAAMSQLMAVVAPGSLPPIRGTLDLGLGWSSTARAGAPADPADSGDNESSPIAQLNIWLRLVAPTGRWVRPSLEFTGRSTGYAARSGRDFSYGLLGARPGIILGDAPGGGALLAYRFEALALAGGDRYDRGPLWLYEAHRAELEAILTEGLTLLGGLGRRRFRESGRSRVELDGGLGGNRALAPKLGLVGALTGRFHGADNPAYELRGGSGLLGLELRLRRGWSLRGSGLISLDWYPRSAGYFNAKHPNLERRDLLAKLSFGVLTPVWHGLRAQLSYELAHRGSTATAYEYTDHRVQLRLSYSFQLDPRFPAARSPKRHVPLSLGSASTEVDSQLSDLLRQEEAASRSSSCVE